MEDKQSASSCSRHKDMLVLSHLHCPICWLQLRQHPAGTLPVPLVPVCGSLLGLIMIDADSNNRSLADSVLQDNLGVYCICTGSLASASTVRQLPGTALHTPIAAWHYLYEILF